MIFKEKKTFKSGFSLMELIVVVGMIGIISSIAIPSIVSSLPDYRLRSATRDIISLFQEARLKAVKENAIVAMEFDFVNNQCRAWVDNGAGGGAGNYLFDQILGESYYTQETLAQGINLYQHLTLGNITNPFAFNNRGFPAQGVGSVGSVFLSNTKSNYRRLIVNQTGSVRVQKSSDGLVWN